MLGEDDIINRITKIRNLREGCFKYLEKESEEMLAHKIIHSIAKISLEKMGPVKLAEIAQDIFSENDKSKQDNIRLTIEKTLLKCGMVEKLRYAVNDVRYILTGYRFQKTKSIESFRGGASDHVGEIFELPRTYWPIPDEYFILRSKKEGVLAAIKKLNSDHDSNTVQKGTYEVLMRELDDRLQRLANKIKEKYSQIDELIGK